MSETLVQITVSTLCAILSAVLILGIIVLSAVELVERLTKSVKRGK